MSNNWLQVKLGDVLRRSEETVELRPDEEYRQITVKLWGKGAVLRGILTGDEVAAPRQMVAHGSQFILSRIDARNGALGIVPDKLDGAIVSNDFPVFNLACDRLLPLYLGWMCKTASFVEKCQRASEGTTNRVRLKEDKFLAMEISLPPLAEQRRIVARIEELSTKIEEARRLRKQATDEATALLLASSLTTFSDVGIPSSIGEVCDVIDPNPSHRYPTYVPDGIPIVSSSEFVGEDGIDPSLAKHVPESFYSATLGSYGVGGGDVIFSRKGKVGYARLHPEGQHLAMTHTLCVIKPNRTKLEPRYLLHFARSPIFLEQLTGTMNPNVGVPTLGLGVIRSAGIPVPSLSEQRRIVVYLDNLQKETDTLKALQAGTSLELDALMPSILDKAFRGEL